MPVFVVVAVAVSLPVLALARYGFRPERDLLPMPLRRFLSDESGSELIEFAVASAVLFTAIFMIFDGSRLLYYNHYVANAARDASRYAMVRGSTWAGTTCADATTLNCAATAQNVTTRVQAASPSITSFSPLSVNATWPGTTATGAACSTTFGSNSPGCLVTVTVNYQFNTMIPFLPSSLVKLSSTSSVTIAQ